MDKFTRLLSLVALLEQRSRPQTFEEIKEHLGPSAYPQRNPESARRSFERDKDDLLAMGVPLRAESLADDPSNTGYTIQRERSRVADPGFTPAELAALRMAATAMALRHEGVNELADATDGLRKYGGMASRPTSGDAPAAADERMAEIRLDSNITELFAGIIDRNPVAFGYNGRTRKVMPRHLSALGGNWYLTCHDLEVGESRTYRLDRIEGAVIPLSEGVDGHAPGRDSAGGGPAGADGVPTGRFRPWEFPPRAHEDGDDAPRGAGTPTTVRVALEAPAAAVALAQHPGLEVARQGGEGEPTVIELSVRNPEGLWNWLLQFMDRAVVLGPEDMRDAYLDHVARLAVAEGGR